MTGKISMAKIDLPKYVYAKKLANGNVAFYFQVPAWARKKLVDGKPCPVQPQALGNSIAGMYEAAERLNDAFEGWRLGRSETLIEGSVSWLFAEYRSTRQFKKLAARTRKDYTDQMERLANLRLKNSTQTLGDLQAAKIDERVADRLYAKLEAAHGVRQAVYAMQVCRRVWQVMKRSVKDLGNPFREMGLTSTPAKGTTEWTRDQYEAFKAAARAQGLQSLATAAALAFELVQREGDVIGSRDDDGIIKGMMWSDYTPGTEFRIRQNKTGRELVIPLCDESGNLLFAELEDELARTPKVGSLIVMRDQPEGSVFAPYKKRHFQALVAKVRDGASLPKELVFSGLRHGGATEIGDAGESDVRSITGHTTIRMSQTYNKVSARKAQTAAKKRQALKDYLAQAKADKARKASTKG